MIDGGMGPFLALLSRVAFLQGDFLMKRKMIYDRLLIDFCHIRLKITGITLFCPAGAISSAATESI
jgi:hypothetical protein